MIFELSKNVFFMFINSSNVGWVITFSPCKFLSTRLFNIRLGVIFMSENFRHWGGKNIDVTEQPGGDKNILVIHSRSSILRRVFSVLLINIVDVFILITLKFGWQVK